MKPQTIIKVITVVGAVLTGIGHVLGEIDKFLKDRDKEKSQQKKA